MGETRKINQAKAQERLDYLDKMQYENNTMGALAAALGGLQQQIPGRTALPTQSEIPMNQLDINKQPVQKESGGLPDWAKMLGEIALSAIPGFADTYFPAKEASATRRMSADAIDMINRGMSDPNQILATLREKHGRKFVDANFDQVRDNVFGQLQGTLDLTGRNMKLDSVRREARREAFLSGQKVNYPGVVNPKVFANDLIQEAQNLGLKRDIENGRNVIKIESDTDYKTIDALREYARKNDVEDSLFKEIFSTDSSTLDALKKIEAQKQAEMDVIKYNASFQKQHPKVGKSDDIKKLLDTMTAHYNISQLDDKTRNDLAYEILQAQRGNTNDEKLIPLLVKLTGVPLKDVSTSTKMSRDEKLKMALKEMDVNSQWLNKLVLPNDSTNTDDHVLY